MQSFSATEKCVGGLTQDNSVHIFTKRLSREQRMNKSCAF